MTAYKNWKQIKTYQRELEGGPKISLDDWLCAKEEEAIAREKAKVNGNGEQPKRFCECAETLIHGKRCECSPWHDCRYTEQRSALCSEAARIATLKIGDPIGD